MYTTDDALFSIVQSCSDGLESGKLIYYVYIYQIAGLDYKFRYKINTAGLSCRGLDNLLSHVINENKVKVESGRISLTSRGSFYLYSVPMTAKEWEFIDFIKTTLDNLTEADLQAICITDLIVYDTLAKYGVKGLVNQENKIKSSIKALCSNDFDDEDFNAALEFLRKVRRENE